MNDKTKYPRMVQLVCFPKGGMYGLDEYGSLHAATWKDPDVDVHPTQWTRIEMARVEPDKPVEDFSSEADQQIETFIENISTSLLTDGLSESCVAKVHEALAEREREIEALKIIQWNLSEQVAVLSHHLTGDKYRQAHEALAKWMDGGYSGMTGHKYERARCPHSELGFRCLGDYGHTGPHEIPEEE